jgi:hypothetical protein
VVLGLDADEAAAARGRGVHDDGVKGGPVAEVAGVQEPWRPLEAERGDPLHPAGPPGPGGPGGQLEVGGQLPEEVEAHRLGGQEVGPEALLVDELVDLPPLEAVLDLSEDRRGQEVRPFRPGLVERQAAAQDAADLGPVPAVGPVHPGRQAIGLPPEGRQQAGLLAEFAAVRGLGDQVAGQRLPQGVGAGLSGQGIGRCHGCNLGRAAGRLDAAVRRRRGRPCSRRRFCGNLPALCRFAPSAGAGGRGREEPSCGERSGQSVSAPSAPVS